MSEVIAYIAPSLVATIEEQIAAARKVVSDEGFIRVDKPKTKSAPLLRTERDFVFDHLLRTAAVNDDGKPDVLWCFSLDVIADNRAEIERLYRALVTLGVPLISESDGLSGIHGMEYTVRYGEALRRAEHRWSRAPVRLKGLRKGSRKRDPNEVKVGRKRIIPESGLPEFLHWVEVDKLKWSAIVARYKERGIEISPDTLARYYKQLKLEEAAKAATES